MYNKSTKFKTEGESILKHNNTIKIAVIAAISTLCAVVLLDGMTKDKDSKTKKTLSTILKTNKDKSYNYEKTDESPGIIDGYSFVRNDPGPTMGSVIHVFKKN